MGELRLAREFPASYCDRAGKEIRSAVTDFALDRASASYVPQIVAEWKLDWRLFSEGSRRAERDAAKLPETVIMKCLQRKSMTILPIR